VKIFRRVLIGIVVVALLLLVVGIIGSIVDPAPKAPDSPPLPSPSPTRSAPATTRAPSPSVTPSLSKSPTQAPEPSPTPSSVPRTSEAAVPETYYENCAAVRAAGAAPIHRGDPGYSSDLDRDGDGIACES
jgi:hypothetical protein